MTSRCTLDLSPTTQGPTYPPSEVMDADGNFIVIGRVNRVDEASGTVRSEWGGAIVAADSPLPPFGQNLAYRVIRNVNPDALTEQDRGLVLCTLPLPLPGNNYPMLFAPEQCPHAAQLVRPSYPFHLAHIPDQRPEDGRRLQTPVTLGDWLEASGQVTVTVAADGRSAHFALEFAGLIPDSLYTMMVLRQRDLDPAGPTRPGPLGIPSAFVTDGRGRGIHTAVMPNPFPAPLPAADGRPSNRVINVILLWMSSQCCYGGAIGIHGLGGDIHAQLKLRGPSFLDLETRA